MSMYNKLIYVGITLVLICVIASLKPANAVEYNGAILMGISEQKALTFPSNLIRVATSDPTLVGVTVTNKNEVLLTAIKDGAAIVTIWQKSETEPLKFSVIVSKTAGEKLSFGTQVQTDIKILEVSKTELNSLGVYYAKLLGGGSAVGLAPPGSGYRGFQGGLKASSALSVDGFNLFSFGASSLSILSALESGGFAYTLAQPSLTCLSGQSATFLSGGEFPIPIHNDNNGVQIEFKKFGVSLSVSPTVIDENRIILKVAPEVSELDFSTGIASGGVSVPGLRVRRSETTVSMLSGETFIISGLVNRSTINNSDRVPGLGNLPVIGALFRSDRISKEDKELIMVVTPHIVKPRSKDDGDIPLPGSEYANSSTRWLDMATQSSKGSQPIKYGPSW